VKKFGKLLLVLTLTLVLAGLSGCSGKASTTSSDAKKTTETANKLSTDPAKQQKQVNDFILKNTKVVKVFNISKRIDQQHPDLGPFFVIQGIDQRGQKSEVWMKDLKIYKMLEPK
jgi:hypothetical protein